MASSRLSPSVSLWTPAAARVGLLVAWSGVSSHRSDCSGLCHLNLEDNNMQDEGASYLAAAIGSPSSWSISLRSLQIAHNFVGVDGAQSLGAALRAEFVEIEAVRAVP